jgi:hypothetical protein
LAWLIMWTSMAMISSYSEYRVFAVSRFM